MNILAIDTSNQVLGIAILSKEQIIGEMITNLKQNQTSRLMPAIHQLMKDIDMEPNQLDKIVVAKGPGSYTGVRIGVTTAKSLAWGLAIPVVGVSSLEVLAYQGRFYDSLICPFFDARRGRIYTGIYQWENHKMNLVLEETNISMVDWLKQIKEFDQEIMFFSPNIRLFKETIMKHLDKLAIFPEETLHIAKPSNLAIAGMNREGEHLHSFVPNYLRLAEAEANWINSKKETKSYGETRN